MGEQEQFFQLMQSLLSTENEIRSQAETTYDGIPLESRVWGTLATIRSPSCSEDIRGLAAVLLRRLFSNEFQEFYPKITPEQQTQLKQEILNCVTQSQTDVLRRKVCDLVGEVVRNMMNDDGVNQWSEFIQFLFECVQSPVVELRIAALLIFQSEPNLFGANQAQYLPVIKSMLGQSLSDGSNTKIQSAAAKALCAFIRENDEDVNTLQVLAELAGPFVNVLHLSIEAGEEDILKGLIDMAESCPKFLRGQIPALMEVCLRYVSDKDNEENLRELCLEVMVTLCETAAAMVRKVGSKYVPILIQETLKMMTEVEEDEEWDTRENDDEDEEESISMVAESAIDRIACGLGGKSVLSHVLALLPVMSNAQEWQARHAALMALSAIGEGCQRQMEGLLPSIMEGVVNFLRDPHPRVRYACCNALGQMSSDFSPTFEKKFHASVVPGLLALLESDPNPRVQAHAGAALVNFSEDCPKSILSIYLLDIITKLEQVLTRKFEELLKQGNKLVLEQVVTTIASVADTAEERFVDFYDRFMPCLKYIVQHANEPKLRMLRGKTIECISLIGLAVGRDKFVKDAGEVMDLLLRTQIGDDGLAEDDPQLSFMISAWARICKILGPDFEPYLPMVMGPVMRTAAMKPEVTVLDHDDMEAVNGAESEDWQFVSLGEQQNFGIRTSGLEDKATACQMLVCYARELKTGFAEYAPEVVKMMVPLLKFYFHDGVRTAAGESLPYLLECAKIRGLDYVKEMWAFIYPDFLKALDQEPETEVFAEFMTALAKCVDALGQEFFTPEMLTTIFAILEKTMKEHFVKEHKRQEKRRDEDYDEEVEEQLLEDRDDDSYVMSRVTEVLHSLFKVYRSALFPYFDQLLPLCNQLLEPDRPWSDHQWSLCIWDDVIEYAGPMSKKYQEFFLQPLLAYVTDQHADVRQAAAYGFGVLAQFGEGAFVEVLSSALPRLAEVINHPDSRSVENIAPTENCISAVCKIMKYSSASVSPEAAQTLVPMYLSWLPVYDDEDEAPHIYGYLADLIEGNHPVVMSDVPAVVVTIAEAFNRDVLQPTNEVYVRLLNIIRQVQNDAPLFNVCLSRMNAEQQRAVSSALQQAPAS